MREVRGERLNVETARQTEAAEGQAGFLPVGCAAQLRKSLAKPRRCDCDFVRAEAAGFDLTGGK